MRIAQVTTEVPTPFYKQNIYTIHKN